jgi:hypothetical protein
MLVRVLLSLGQIAITFAPALVLSMAMAFDGEDQRGKGSDFDSLFFLLAWSLVAAVVVAGLWLTWSSRSVPLFSLRFWAPSALTLAATVAVFGLLFLSQLHAAHTRYAELRAQMVEMRAELGAGDAHRACELVALSTRDNLTATTLTVAREDEVRACLAHTRTLAPEERRAALDTAFLLAGTFLTIDAAKAGRPVADWSRSFPPFPASTQADILRGYFTTRLSLPNPVPRDYGALLQLFANVRKLPDWDASAQRAFADEVRPQLLACVEDALHAPQEPDTLLLLRRLRAVLASFPEDPPANTL